MLKLIRRVTMVCLVLAVAACGGDDGGSGSPTPPANNNTNGMCSAMTTIFNCTKLDACCNAGGTACWYDTVKAGTNQRFDCAGTNCQAAASEAVNYCMQ